MSEPDPIRKKTMAKLEQLAAAIFAAYPEVRSVMCGFAQYWADEADDAIHTHLIASNREVPLWPHPCDADDGV